MIVGVKNIVPEVVAIIRISHSNRGNLRKNIDRMNGEIL